ncbi:Glycoside hydrolase [Mycena sanguinolenta]|uniref:Glycoside hydrolase n=1 Tax=Mycena sanguinolenta TaxID=230812 RepID=A0A8H6XKW2_9AGAR|nr:Glycoside hydrolase [Mycena sanguinolenta]
MTGQQRVLILGATGKTGQSILHALLKEPQSFDVEALVRPASVGKPEVQNLAAQGVKIHVVDISGPMDQLIRVLTGVDVFISAIDAMGQRAQLGLVKAAKSAGVKRFVPCAFITVAPPGGVMALRDSKEEVYQEIWKESLPYTIIDVGYWHQISFPTLPSGRVDYASVITPQVQIHAGGTAPNMLTDLRDIGAFTSLIIKDPRTLNKFVVTYSDVLSENEIFALMEEISGEKIQERQYATDEIIAMHEGAAANARAKPNDWTAQTLAFIADYTYSKYVRGDNNPSYAKYLRVPRREGAVP